MIESNRYHFGTVYLIEYGRSFDEIKRDLELIKESYFDLVTLWPVNNPWLCECPEEFVFDDTIKVLDYCATLGMKAILQLFGQNHSQEFMPDSMVSEDMLVNDTDGVNNNCFWVNLNHSKVRMAMNLYIEKAVSALKSHRSVFAWDIFNEAHFDNDDEYTTRKYQDWLRDKYGDIRNLNLKWSRRYGDFSQITPRLRRANYSVWSSLLPSYEYEKFRSENLTEICQWLYDEVKKHDESHPIIIDGTSGQIIYDSVILRNNDEYATAQIPDIYGATFYPRSWGRDYVNELWRCALYFTIPYSAAEKAGKPYFVNELQTHTQSALTPGSEVSPELLSIWIWLNIAMGAKGLQLWRWRPFIKGFQATGRGLTQLDGAPSPRREKVKELVGTLREYEAKFANSRPEKPTVGLVLSYRSRLFYDSLKRWEHSEMPDILAGWYRLFWEIGVNPGVTELEFLDEKDMTTPILILPTLISINDKEAEWFRAYVENGGTLIADARLGLLDEWGVAPSSGLPGIVLRQVFGLKEIDVKENGNFILNNEKIKAPFMSQILDIDSGVEVLAQDEVGAPSFVKNSYGKGRTYYFNSFMGLHWVKGGAASQKLFFESIIDEVFPGTVFFMKSDRVHTALHTVEDNRLLFIINCSDSSEIVKIKNFGDFKTENVSVLCEVPEISYEQLMIKVNPQSSTVLSIRQS